jgi:hypothetical protein
MLKRTCRGKVWIIAIILVLTGLPIAHAQQCIGDLSSFRIGSKGLSSDGKIHITYGFADASSNAVKSAAAAAFAQWNGMSNTTKVVFEPVPVGGSPDIQFKPSENEAKTKGCAGYSPDSDRIYFSPGLDQAAQFSTSAGATIIAHEIGHFLGLDEAGTNPSSPTIMNNGSGTPGTTCLQAAQNVPTTTVQSSDAAKVPSCVAQARSQHTVGLVEPNSPYNNYYYIGGNCYDTYLVTDYYQCFGGDGCTYVLSTYEYIGTSCY